MARHRGGRVLAICVLVTFVVAVFFGAPACADDAIDVQAIDALMLRLMATYGVPGASLALIKDGRVVLERGYGYRDLATHAPVTTGTLFSIGSISKSFTALGIAQLVDQHKVDLDTPIIKYVPELRLSDPGVTQRVTLRQLLSHTSGLPPDAKWNTPAADASHQQIVHDMATVPITAAPGARFQYCTQCFLLAAYVLERMTGQSWEAYTRAHIFGPLGMATASFGSFGLERAQDAAQPYRPYVFGQVPVLWEALRWMEPLAPGGGIDASVADMARYALFQLGDGTASGRQLVSPPMLAELHRPEIATRDSPAEDIRYALGWFTSEHRGVHLIFHSGRNPGFRANITLVPSVKAGLVILANAEGAGLFVQAVRLTLVDELLEMTPRHDLAHWINCG
ncbi:MAG TPA: serine hydrolase domain-containing protein [bacterium]|nr:serine hydrolase domain-containing protein [bacterium]